MAIGFGQGPGLQNYDIGQCRRRRTGDPHPQRDTCAHPSGHGQQPGGPIRPRSAAMFGGNQRGVSLQARGSPSTAYEHNSRSDLWAPACRITNLAPYLVMNFIIAIAGSFSLAQLRNRVGYRKLEVRDAKIFDSAGHRSTAGFVRPGASAQASQPYVGEIVIVAFNFAPNGWATCNGTIALYLGEWKTLFQLIGTTYGGDGQSTFALPDPPRPPSPSIKGQGPGLNSYVLGRNRWCGKPSPFPSIKMPSHEHPVSGTIGLGQHCYPHRQRLGLPQSRLNVYSSAKSRYTD